ncbi:MAG: hypothetical protein ACLTDR_13330 [Adlercreutzia equolifaciens]
MKTMAITGAAAAVSSSAVAPMRASPKMPTQPLAS